MYILYRKLLLALVCLILFFYKGSSQVIDSKNCDSTRRFFISKYVQLLKTSHNLPLDTVLQLRYQQQFKRLNEDVVFSGFDPYYYWFKFIIANNDTTAKDLSLLLGPIGMRDSELFRSEKGKWKSLGKTGNKYPFIKRAYQYAHSVYPITLPASSVDTFYLRIDFGHEYRSYAFVLMQSQLLMKFENKAYFLLGIIVGLLLLFFILNLYLFFLSKEKLHLWYSLYIVMLILIVLKNDSLDEQFLGMDSEIRYRLLILMGIGASTIGILMHVVQLFLINIQRTTLLYRITAFIKINVFFSAIAYIVFFNLQPNFNAEIVIFHWANWSTIIGICMIIINSVYSAYKGFRGALFILLALTVFFIGAFERLLQISTTSYLFPPNLFHYGMVVETIIISFALIYRYRLDRKEKIAYQREKQQLEANLNKDILERKLEMQEDTFKNISEEIHDNIGQLLSLAKLNLNMVESAAIVDGDEKINEAKTLLSKAIQDLRDLSKSLNSDFIIEIGLVKSVEFELDLIKKLCTCETTLTITGKPFSFNDQHHLILFRIIQQALNNIIKTIKPTFINIEITFLNTEIVILIKAEKDVRILSDNNLRTHTEDEINTDNMKNLAKTIGGIMSTTIDDSHSFNLTIKLPVMN